MAGEIGGFIFNRIPNNVSRLVVKGMNVVEDDTTDIADDEFASVTTGSDPEEDLAGEA
jgi:hypothetical protein